MELVEREFGWLRPWGDDITPLPPWVYQHAQMENQQDDIGIDWNVSTVYPYG